MMSQRDPHTWPNRKILAHQRADGLHWVLIETQWSKVETSQSIHVGSTVFQQLTIAYPDFLQLFGFRRCPNCKVVPEVSQGCVWRDVTERFQLGEFRERALKAISAFRRAERLLCDCGFRIPLPISSLYYEGSGYRLREPVDGFAGDGHDTDPHHSSPRLEDDRFRFFHYCFSRKGRHGFAHHVSPKAQLSFAESEAMELIGFRRQAECPFFDCAPCFWAAWPSADPEKKDFQTLDEQYHAMHRRYHERQPGRLAQAVSEICLCRDEMLPLGWDIFDVLTSATAPMESAVRLEERGPRERITTAVVFTDIIDSTALQTEVGDEAMAGIRRAHFSKSRELVERFSGRQIKTMGDGVLAVFNSADAALDFALALLSDAGHARLHVRAGIHVGPVEFEAGDVFGSTVNFAARVLGTVSRRGVCLSQRAKDDIDSLASERHCTIEWTRHDNLSLKGIPGLFTLWSTLSTANDQA